MTENQQKDDNQKNDNSTKGTDCSTDVKMCPICLAVISNRALTNACTHEFCFDCISQWSANHNRCPICRSVYSNIKYNIVSNETFSEMPVEEQADVDEEEIEAILRRMLLYLRLIGLRNRTQRRLDQLTEELSTTEDQFETTICTRSKTKDLTQKINELRTEQRQLNQDLSQYNQVLGGESPSEELLTETLDGREDEIQDIEVIDIIFDPELLQFPGGEDSDSFGSINLESIDSGHESDDERESDEEDVNRKRKNSQEPNTDQDDSGGSAPKRPRQ